MNVARRTLLAAAIGAANSLFAAAGTRAQTKASQRDARYQAVPKDGQSCAMCQLFRPPQACEVVAGDISPTGWCSFFSLPD